MTTADNSQSHSSILRTQLTLLDVYEAPPPHITWWENVPGVLSTKDNAFGCFLAGLAGEDCELQPPGKRWANAGCVYGPKRTVAWRILDAQYFGLAQRRRRVFVVASAREGFDPVRVLFESDGVRRDSAPSREAGAGSAVGTLGGTSPGGGWRFGADEAAAGQLVAQAFGGANSNGLEVSTTLNAAKSASGRMDFETETFIVQPPVAFSFDVKRDLAPHGLVDLREIASPLTATDYKDPQAVCITGDVTHTLKAEGFDASEDGTGRGQPIIAFNARQDPDCWQDRTGQLDTDGGTQAIAFSCKDYGADASGELAPTLRAMGHTGSHPNAGGQMAVAFQSSQSGVRLGDAHATLDSNNGSRRHNGVVSGMQVRRLTPRECERLQGFPDDYTLIPVKAKRAKLPSGAGPCAKQTVTATVVTEGGMHYVGTNYTVTPQAECPRAGLPTGQGYELCRDVCQQPAHAEVNAIRLAGKLAAGAFLYLEGHSYVCDACKAVAEKAGIAQIIIGPPPGNAADGPRYKALGNSMAVPVMRWIGRRIDFALGNAMRPE